MSSTTASKSEPGPRPDRERWPMVAAAVLSASLTAATLLSCSTNERPFAYTGRMEVDSIIVSSQSSGIIDSIDVREGDSVKKGGLIAQINTDRLVAQRRQQEAQLAELGVKRSAAEAQIGEAKARLRLARDTLGKTERLLAGGGATPQRRDELSTEVEVDTANLAALQANERLVAAQEEVLRAGMGITDLAIRDAHITSPIDGVVLNKFHFAGELATVGTPLVELADLSLMTVEIYVPLEKLAAVTIGEKATISVDGMAKPYLGSVYWISSEAEFTPKTIQTQETKTTLVYGVKIHVPNPGGKLKIGMPVDVRL